MCRYTVNVNKLYKRVQCEEITYDVLDAELARWGFDDRAMVHATHCYVEYGCKYGEDKDCPVMTRQLKQVYEFNPDWM